jgi:hypothetical protein
MEFDFVCIIIFLLSITRQGARYGKKPWRWKFSSSSNYAPINESHAFRDASGWRSHSPVIDYSDHTRCIA